MEKMLGTTIIGVRRDGKTVIGGDSQATLGDMIFKSTAVKVRKIYDGKVIVGFAGSVSDAFALFRKVEEGLNKYSGNLQRTVVEVARSWQTSESMSRKLEAMLLVANKDLMYVVSGDGNVIEPTDNFISIGSGQNFALGAARALYENTKLSAREIAEKALLVASEYCIYTNNHLVIEEVM